MYALSRALRVRRVQSLTPIVGRQFSASTVAWKKAKPAPKNGRPTSSSAPESSEPVPDFDIKAVESQLSKSLELFAAKIKEIKAGSSGTSRFTTLDVELTGGETTALQNIATVAARGNKVVIVAFDPNNVKHIRSAIVGQLGMPAEEAKDDKQALTVTIPPEGNKNDLINKQLKDAFEHFRNSGHRSSLSSIRTKFLNPLKKSSQAKTSADIKKQIQQIENVAKTYNTKLQEQFKKAELR